MPALLVFAIIGIAYVKISANAETSRKAKEANAALASYTTRSDAALKKLAHDNAVDACSAVHSSDVALHDFLVLSIGSGPRAKDSGVQKFLDDLAFAQNVTYGRCLAKANGG